MKVTVIGTGYVGLVSGACFADLGNDVLCLDIDERKVAQLRAGGIPIHEPGLEAIVRRNVAAGRLNFTTDPQQAATFGRVQFLAVGTPPGEDGSADLQYVIAAARSIGRYLDGYCVIVDKSTVPVGTADLVREAIAEELAQRGVSHPFSVVSNPEFLKEGAAVEDFMRPDRVVLGVSDDRALRIMRELYAPAQRNHERLIVMDVRSAELTKYAANAMLATRISFMNELANLAERLGADIEQVRKGIGSDSRIGYDFLYAGVGFGGSCFPKDVRALRHTARQCGMDLAILEAVHDVNERQKHVLVDKVVARFGASLAGRRFALWGLSFKPNTDDMREAPSLVIIDALLARGATVNAYDPVAMDVARSLLEGHAGVTLSDTARGALQGCDALLIVTEWKEFRSPDFESIRGDLRHPVIIDGRNLYDPAMVTDAGIEYYPIGRAQSKAAGAA
jgi:UDPglucose 6-dehydrogenase